MNIDEIIQAINMAYSDDPEISVLGSELLEHDPFIMMTYNSFFDIPFEIEWGDSKKPLKAYPAENRIREDYRKWKEKS